VTQRRVKLAARETDTRVTRVLTGRHARGLVNEFMRLLEGCEGEVPAYPVQNALTGEIRKAAAAAGRPEFLSLWAGQAVPLLARRPAGQRAAELVAALVAETGAALDRATGTLIAAPR
jgi:nitronate monooxygenase